MRCGEDRMGGVAMTGVGSTTGTMMASTLGIVPLFLTAACGPPRMDLSASSTDEGVIHRVSDVPACSWGGSRVLGLDDVNGDGSADYAVAFTLCNEGQHRAGQVRVHSGSDGSELWRIDGASRDSRLGSILLSPGDLDADGVPDLLVGESSSKAQAASPGSARLTAYSGADRERLFVVDLGIDEPRANAVAVLGDLDGDGSPEIAVITGLRGGAGRSAGVLEILSGRNGAPIYRRTQVLGDARPAPPLCAAGDIDGDGTVELVLGVDRTGAEEASGSFALAAVSPRTWTVSWEVAGSPTAQMWRGGDFDRDGVADLLLVNGSEEVTALSGATGTTLARLEGDQSLSAFGNAVASSRDVDGDGVADILVGGWSYDGGPGRIGNDYGKLWLFSGSSWQLLGHLTCDERHGHLGGSVALIADLDGDAVPECVAGCNLPVPGGEPISGAIVVSGVKLLSRVP